jgi:hypothetical protein
MRLEEFLEMLVGIVLSRSLTHLGRDPLASPIPIKAVGTFHAGSASRSAGSAWVIFSTPQYCPTWGINNPFVLGLRATSCGGPPLTPRYRTILCSRDFISFLVPLVPVMLFFRSLSYVQLPCIFAIVLPFLLRIEKQTRPIYGQVQHSTLVSTKCTESSAFLWERFPGQVNPSSLNPVVMPPTSILIVEAPVVVDRG